MSGKLAVEVGSGNNYCLIFSEALGCLAHGGEYHRQMVVELLFYDVENALLVGVDTVPQRLALVEWKSLDFLAEFFDGCTVFGSGFGDGSADVVDFAAKAVVVEGGYTGHFFFDGLELGLDGLEVAHRFVAEYLFKE